jgi:hypothetical protein
MRASARTHASARLTRPLAPAVESTGLAGCVQMSEATFDATGLPHGLTTVRRFEVKGKGAMATHVLEAGASLAAQVVDELSVAVSNAALRDAANDGEQAAAPEPGGMPRVDSSARIAALARSSCERDRTPRTSRSGMPRRSPRTSKASIASEAVHGIGDHAYGSRLSMFSVGSGMSGLGRHAGIGASLPLSPAAVAALSLALHAMLRQVQESRAQGTTSFAATAAAAAASLLLPLAAAAAAAISARVWTGDTARRTARLSRSSGVPFGLPYTPGGRVALESYDNPRPADRRHRVLSQLREALTHASNEDAILHAGAAALAELFPDGEEDDGIARAPGNLPLRGCAFALATFAEGSGSDVTACVHIACEHQPYRAALAASLPPSVGSATSSIVSSVAVACGVGATDNRLGAVDSRDTESHTFSECVLLRRRGATARMRALTHARVRVLAAGKLRRLQGCRGSACPSPRRSRLGLSWWASCSCIALARRRAWRAAAWSTTRRCVSCAMCWRRPSSCAAPSRSTAARQRPRAPAPSPRSCHPPPRAAPPSPRAAPRLTAA